jgi:hypothetical protein
VIGVILREVVKPPAVLVDTPGTLLQVQELLKLASHQTRGYVVSPPSTSGPTKLLGHVQSLLELDTV